MLNWTLFWLYYHILLSTLGSEISVEEAADILDLVGQTDKSVLVTKTALQLLIEEQSNQPILTLSQSIDTLLGGGIPLSKVTEIAGIAGVGKTQIWYVLSSIDF